ncbi:hypothetical protein [Pseudofrankia sp. BMG5.37]|uniref:hypothetical protein n=1 Tax=Pseudofrankia sp. BMG5.37 TaxID=3050035 RepID=UPI002895AE19|nr:hypothetical protein [Pseudofrankia sp. BMG5.37]MDT3442871.1 hypothetical protein [Pseudofrankia sp. BMG5.37]
MSLGICGPGEAEEPRTVKAARTGGGLTAAERKATERRARYRRRRRIIRAGQVLMAVGAVVALAHPLARWEVFGGQPSGLVDLVAGYPIAAALFFAGAVAAGQRQ